MNDTAFLWSVRKVRTDFLKVARDIIFNPSRFSTISGTFTLFFYSKGQLYLFSNVQRTTCTQLCITSRKRFSPEACLWVVWGGNQTFVLSFRAPSLSIEYCLEHTSHEISVEKIVMANLNVFTVTHKHIICMIRSGKCSWHKSNAVKRLRKTSLYKGQLAQCHSYTEYNFRPGDNGSVSL